MATADHLRQELVSKSFSAVNAFTCKMRQQAGEVLVHDSADAIIDDAIAQHFKSLSILNDMTEYQRRNPKLSEVRLQAQHAKGSFDEPDEVSDTDDDERSGDGDGAARMAAAHASGAGTTSTAGLHARHLAAAPPPEVLKKIQAGRVKRDSGGCPDSVRQAFLSRSKSSAAALMAQELEEDFEQGGPAPAGAAGVAANLRSKSFLAKGSRDGAADGMLSQLRNSRFYEEDVPAHGPQQGKIMAARSFTAGASSRNEGRSLNGAKSFTSGRRTALGLSSAVPGVSVEGPVSGRSSAAGSSAKGSPSIGASRRGRGFFNKLKDVFK